MQSTSKLKEPIKKSNFKIKKIPGYKFREDIDYKPKSEAQEMMLVLDFANIEEVIMGGAGGSGKTVALIISSMGPQSDGTFLTDKKDYTGLIFRREATQLEKSGLIRAANEWYSKFYPSVEFNSSLKKFTFPSGATITFAGCESEDDAFKFKGFTKLHFIGFEELTQFTERQFEILTSRLRDAANDLPLRIRGTTNPGDIHEEWVLEKYKYWLYDDCIIPIDTPIKASYAMPLYRHIDREDPDMKVVISQKKPLHDYDRFCFIQTFADDIMADNKITMAKRLSDPVLRAQLVSGQWGLKSGAGMYFASNDLFEAHQRPSSATRIRYWDKACSGESGDFLCGMLVSHSIEGQSKFLIEDVILAKIEAPKVKDLIIKTAQADGKNVYIGFEQEPGSSGKELMDIYKRELEQMHFRVIVDAKKESKLNRAQFISPLAKENRIGFIHCQSTNEMMKQLINFPSKGVHDDCVDALSGSIILLSNHLPRPSTYIGPKKDMTSVYLQMEDIRGTPSVFR